MVSWFDKLPLVVRVILVLFLDPIIMGIYRILKGHVLGGILWIFTGGLFVVGWIIDLVQVIQGKKVTILA